MDSSATESPLDVLSRAATMVQDNTFNTLPPSYDEARLHLKCKESASSAGKWSKPRRSTRHPATVVGSGVTTAILSGHNTTNSSKTDNSILLHPEPIDMSIAKKLRCSPPSYQQTIQLRQQLTATNGRPQRPSVITSCLGNSNNSSDLSDGEGVCDSVVDDHFRRSLGKDYKNVFSSNNNNKNNTIPNGKRTDIITEDEGSPLSVDDHFAKALGDTWLKLQQIETEKKKKEDGDSTVMQVEQVQDVSTSNTTIPSVINTKSLSNETPVQKSLSRHDRRLP